MALLGNLVYRITADSQGFEKGIDSAKTKSEKFHGILGKATKILAGVGGALALVGGAAIKSASEFEQYTASFETMLGNADKAKKLLAEIQKFSAATPFQLSDLTQGAQTLLAFNIQAKDLMPTLKMLGDVSLGNKEKFSSLTLAFAQMSSTGRLMGQDLLQMINAGFNPLAVMAEKSGKSIGELKKQMEKGAISSADVTEAFKIATSEGGKFFNAMEKQSQTFAGRLSTLKDNVMLLAKDLGEMLLPIAGDLLETLMKLVKSITGNKELMEILSKSIKQVGDALIKILPVIMDLINAVLPLTEVLLEFNAELLDELMPVIKEFVSLFSTIMSAVIPVIKTFLDFIKVALEPLLIMLGAYFGAISDIVSIFVPLEEKTAKHINQLQKEVSTVNSLVNKYDDLKNKTILNEKEKEELRKTEEELIKVLPKSAIEFDNQGRIVSLNTDIIKKNQAEKIKLARNEQYEVTKNLKLQRRELDKNIAKRKYNIDELKKNRGETRALHEKELQQWEEEREAINRRYNQEIDKLNELDDELYNLQTGRKNYVDDYQTQSDTINAINDSQSKNFSENGNKIIEVVNKIREAQLYSIKHIKETDIASMEARAQAYEQWTSLVTSQMGDMFSALGEQLVVGGDLWLAFGKAGVTAVAAILDALGNEALAQAAVETAKAIAALAGIYTAALAPGHFAAAAAWGTAGAAAKIGAGIVRALASQIKLASGGFVLPNRGGTPVIMAEGGVGEFAVPDRANIWAAIADRISKNMNRPNNITNNNYNGVQGGVPLLVDGDQLTAHIQKKIDNRAILSSRRKPI